MGLLRSPPTRIPQPLPQASPPAEESPASPLTQPASPQAQESQSIQTQPFQSQSQIARSPPQSQTQIPQLVQYPQKQPFQSQSQVPRSPPASQSSSDLLQLQNINANLATLLQQTQNKKSDLETELEQLKQSNEEVVSDHQRQFDDLKKERQAELEQRDSQIDELLQAVKEEKEDLLKEVEEEKAAMRREIEEEREKMRSERLREKESLGKEVQDGSKEVQAKLAVALDQVAMLQSDLRLAKYDAEVRAADEVLDVIRESEKERKARLELANARTELHEMRDQLAVAANKLSNRSTESNRSLQERHDALAESFRVNATTLSKTDAAKRKAEQRVRTLETELAAAKQAGGSGANYEELVTELKCTKKELKVAEKRLREAGETIAQVSRERQILAATHTMIEDEQRQIRDDYDAGVRGSNKKIMKYKGPSPMQKVAAASAADAAAKKRKRAAEESEEESAVVPLPSIPSPAKRPRIEVENRYQIELSDSEDNEEPQPSPKKRGRPPKTSAHLPSTQDAQVKKPRGRPRKHPLPDSDAPAAEPSPPKKRGRPKKIEEEKTEAAPVKAVSPKRPVGRPRKNPESPAKSAVAKEAIFAAPMGEFQPKKLGRPKKTVEQRTASEDDDEAESLPPKKPGRPTKAAHVTLEADEAIASASEPDEQLEEPPAKKPRGRPKKVQPDSQESPPKKRGRPKKVVESPPVEDGPGSGQDSDAAPAISKQLLATKERVNKPTAKAKKAEAASAVSLGGPPAAEHKRTTSAAALLAADGSRSPEPDLLKTKKKKIKLAAAPSVEKWAQDWEMQDQNAFDLPTHLSPVKGGHKGKK